MNHFLLKFSDGDLIQEKKIDGFIKSIKKKKPIKKKIIKLKKVKVVNQAKGLTYPDFLKTKYWFSVRKSVLYRDRHKCTVCGSKDHLHVHHLSYTYHGFEHLYLEDLVTLCTDCHKIAHGLI